MNRQDKPKIAVVGLGYVGLPLAVHFANKFDVIGFDLDSEKINKYINGKDPTEEVGEEAIKASRMLFTDNPKKLREANFIIVAVPTPINLDKSPNLEPLLKASKLVGENMQGNGTIVVYESTVYPSVTEEKCVPEIERASGMKCGEDFYVGYSPERINPGDKVNTVKTIKKIVSGMDEKTLNVIANVYSQIIEAGVHKAESIKVAEAAKVLENSQRDVNIAFMNEMSMACHQMGINTADVIRAMNTKWNALNFVPGLVGGHCIGVDPYYFIYEAENQGYHSNIISAARRINDDMPKEVAHEIVKQIILLGKNPREVKVHMLGLTFKGNCPDLRNTKSEIVMRTLESYKMKVEITDVRADQEEVAEVFGKEAVPFEEISQADCLIFAANHKEYAQLQSQQIEKLLDKEGCKLVIDLCNIYSQKKFEGSNINYWNL